MEKIAIFGAGAIGKKAILFFGANNIICIVDNDEKKNGTEISGIPVVSLRQYAESFSNVKIYVCVENNEPIIKQLINNGITRFGVFSVPYRREFVHELCAEDYLSPSVDRYNSLKGLFSEEKANEYNSNNKWDVCLCGIPMHANYGTHLTYYALYNYLCSLGYSVIVLGPPLDAEPKPVRFPMLFRDNEGYRKYDVSPIYENEERMREINNKTDVFILGSDQMWNLSLIEKSKMSYLDFVDDSKTLLSYSTSFGEKEWKENDVLTDKLQKSLNRYSAISVREKSGVDICRQIFGIEAVQCIDPVFLQPKSFYEDIVGQPMIKKNRSLVAYLFEVEKYEESIIRLAEENNYEYSFLLHRELYVHEWLKQIGEADLFIMNSYHGMCFAIILRVQFIVLEYKWSDRMHDLLKLIGLEDRIVSVDELNNIDINSFDTIDYDEVWDKLNNKIDQSKEWFSSQLEKYISR